MTVFKISFSGPYSDKKAEAFNTLKQYLKENKLNVYTIENEYRTGRFPLKSSLCLDAVKYLFYKQAMAEALAEGKINESGKNGIILSEDSIIDRLAYSLYSEASLQKNEYEKSVTPFSSSIYLNSLIVTSSLDMLPEHEDFFWVSPLIELCGNSFCHKPFSLFLKHKLPEDEVIFSPEPNYRSKIASVFSLLYKILAFRKPSYAFFVDYKNQEKTIFEVNKFMLLSESLIKNNIIP
jgi:hypothetical protein